MQPLGCLGDGDSTAEYHSSPESQPCSPGPYKSRKRVGIKVQWDFPGASQLAPSCPQKASSKGSCQSFWGKAHPKSLCPLHHVPEELRDPFRSRRDRSAPSQLSSRTGPCLRGSGSFSLESRLRAQQLHREREKRLRGGRKPGKQSMQGRRRRCLLPRGNLHPCSCTYQPVEEVGHLHLGEVGGFYLWFLVSFGWW